MKRNIIAVASMAAALTLPVSAQTGANSISLASDLPRSMVELPCNNTTASHVKLNVTKLGLRASTDQNNMYCQLAEIEIYDADGNNIAPQASFVSTDEWGNGYNWKLSYINNGIIANESTGYTSSPTNNSTVDITITATLNGTHQISRVVLYPRQSDTAVGGKKAANFPSSYSLSLSADGTSYTEMANVADADAPDFALPADASASFNAMLAGADKTLAATEVYVDCDNAVASLKQTAVDAAEKAAAVGCAAAVAEQTDAVSAAVKTFVGTVDMNEGKYFDLTFLLANPAFDSNATDGWSYNPAPGYDATGRNAEYFQKDFDFHQTLAAMPEGQYTLNVQAFERIGTDNAAAFTAYNNGTDETDTYIYLNGCDNNRQQVKNLMSEGSATQLYSASDWHSDVQYTTTLVSGGDDLFRPNSMVGAAQYFAQNMYDNAVSGRANGDLTVGICGTGADGDWTLFDNFRLYFHGSATFATIDEDADFSLDTDMDNATVTLVRNIKAGVWNTVCLPFSLTDSETKAAFGSDTKVAVFSENSADAANATVNFNTKADARIEANVPVLLKTSTEGSVYTFRDRTVKASNGAAPKAEGTNFSLVGSYKATVTVPEGSYFISNDKLYPSKGITTLKGTRAYIAPNGNASDAKIAHFTIDNSELTGIDLVSADGNITEQLWTLGGQRINNTANGIVIDRNGKKTIKKH